MSEDEEKAALKKAAEAEAEIKRAQSEAMGSEVASQGRRLSHAESDIDELQERQAERSEMLRSISGGVQEGLGHSRDIKVELGIDEEQKGSSALVRLHFVLVLTAYLCAFSAGILIGHLVYKAWVP